MCVCVCVLVCMCVYIYICTFLFIMDDIPSRVVAPWVSRWCNCIFVRQIVCLILLPSWSRPDASEQERQKANKPASKRASTGKPASRRKGKRTSILFLLIVAITRGFWGLDFNSVGWSLDMASLVWSSEGLRCGLSLFGVYKVSALAYYIILLG